MKKGIFALLLVILLLTGCMGEKIERGTLTEKIKEINEQKIELSLFYSGENINWIAAIEELCEAFMSSNPDIILQVEYSNSGNYTEELKAKEAADEFGYFEIDNPYMFKTAGKLGEVNSEVASLVENPVIMNGKIYALPFYSTSYGIVYNKVLFKAYGIEIPKTYQDFLKVCKLLKSKGVAPLAVGGNEDSAVCGWLNYFFLTEVEKNNSNWQKKRMNGEVSFQDVDMQTALEDFQDLMNGQYILEDSINMGDNQIINHMINQEVAMYYGTPAMLAKIIDAYPQAVDSDKTPLGEELKNDTVQLRLGWFYMPDEDGNSVVMEKIGSRWSVSRKTMEDQKKREAVKKFLNFVTEERITERYCRLCMQYR